MRIPGSDNDNLHHVGAPIHYVKSFAQRKPHEERFSSQCSCVFPGQISRQPACTFFWLDTAILQVAPVGRRVSSFPYIRGAQTAPTHTTPFANAQVSHPNTRVEDLYFRVVNLTLRLSFARFRCSKFCWFFSFELNGSLVVFLGSFVCRIVVVWNIFEYGIDFSGSIWIGMFAVSFFYLFLCLLNILPCNIIFCQIHENGRGKNIQYVFVKFESGTV